VTIDRIFIACYVGDVRLTRACVASIRRWYPKIRITLIKDYSQGSFSTRDLCRRWEVDELVTGRTNYGWSLSKLEPLFLKEQARCFIMDSDIVFLGPVLDALGRCDADFIVSGYPAHEVSSEEILKHYLDIEKLKVLDPEFQPPPFYFNAGHLVATTGVFSRSDLSHIIDWSGVIPYVRDPKTYCCADQGVLNYFLHQQAGKGRITLESIDFAQWPKTPRARGLRFAESLSHGGIPFMLHWAGLRKPFLRDMIRHDIIEFFENEYYRGVRFGGAIKLARAASYAWTSYRIKLVVGTKIKLGQSIGPRWVAQLKRFFRAATGE